MPNRPIDLAQFKVLLEQLNGSKTDALVVGRLIHLIDHIADRIIDLELKVESTEKQIEALDEDVDYLMRKDQEDD